MPLDLLLGLRIAIDTFWYNLLLSLAGLHWGLLRGLVMMGYIVEVINRWLAQNAFSPLIQMTNNTLEVAVGLAFIVALFVLGITYLLAAIIRLDVVSPRSAVVWYIAGSLFFAAGPSLYQGMNDFRMTIAEGFYLSALNGLQGSVGGTFGSLSQVQSTDLGIGTICDHLGVYLPNAAGPGRIDGLDVALAYLRADGPDVMGYPQPFCSPGCPPHLYNPLTGAFVSPIPQEWYFPGSYFDVAQGPPLAFDTLTDAQRAASIAIASSSQGRLLTAWPLVLFGVVEQLVYLLITIAQGLTFISFGVAILFAFFKRTEVIANSILNQWIELIVQTVIIALIQALVVALFLAMDHDIACTYFAPRPALLIRAELFVGVHVFSLLVSWSKQVCERTPFFTSPCYSVELPPDFDSLQKRSLTAKRTLAHGDGQFPSRAGDIFTAAFQMANAGYKILADPAGHAADAGLRHLSPVLLAGFKPDKLDGSEPEPTVHRAGELPAGLVRGCPLAVRDGAYPADDGGGRVHRTRPGIPHRSSAHR
ncbi:MAG: hypothetical protein JNM70_01690 [Anaerolineae bacterium]|nr:hypothetical protein [Anaerolineae bacterium]